MTSVLLLGQGPKPDSQTKEMGFAQLRLWSLEKFLKREGFRVHTVLVPKTIQPDFSIHVPAHIDVAVTAGPFSVAYSALSLPKSLPLWLDWPSDPRADLHAKIHAPQSIVSDEDILQVALLHKRALARADEIAVISHRQRWNTISACMDDVRSSDLHHHVHVQPIAFDFPHPICPPKNSFSRAAVALCGGINTWFDDNKAHESLFYLLEHLPHAHIHVFGGAIQGHYSAGSKRVRKWKHPHLHHHDWLKQQDFLHLIEQCDIGVWWSRDGLESSFGSRTRALFFAWQGLSVAAHCQTELFYELCNAKVAHPLPTPSSLYSLLQQSPQHSIQDYCIKHFSPHVVYQPLQEWLKNPKKRMSGHVVDKEKHIHQLEKELASIYSSPTWRWSNRLHRLLQRIKKNLGK